MHPNNYVWLDMVNKPHGVVGWLIGGYIAPEYLCLVGHTRQSTCDCGYNTTRKLIITGFLIKGHNYNPWVIPIWNSFFSCHDLVRASLSVAELC